MTAQIILASAVGVSLIILVLSMCRSRAWAEEEARRNAIKVGLDTDHVIKPEGYKCSITGHKVAISGQNCPPHAECWWDGGECDLCKEAGETDG